MPLPPVVIELSTADAASPHASALVRACTEAVSDGECRTGATDEVGARAVVIVSWEEGRRQARIEIGLRREGKNRWVSRRLDFKTSDPEPERWRAVGLVVGTLVGETEREAEQAKATEPAPAPAPAPTPAPAPAPAPARAAAPAPEPRAPTRLWLGVDVVAGPAFDEGSWRVGAGVLALYDIPGLPVLGTAAGRYVTTTADDRDVDVRWYGLSLGLGLRQEPLPGLRLEGRGEAILERMEASVGGAQRDSAGRWYPGMRLALGAGPELGDWGLLVASAEITGITQGTVVTLESNEVGRAPPLTWALTVGARLRLF